MAIRVFHLEPDFFDCFPSPAPCTLASSMDIVAGLERVYDLRETLDFSAVNMSLGGGSSVGPCDAVYPDMTSVIENLRDAGIATVIASGNDSFLNGPPEPPDRPAAAGGAVAPEALHQLLRDASGPAG